MALNNNLKLLFITSYLIIPLCLARAGLSPDSSPPMSTISAPEPATTASPSPSPLGSVSFPPESSDPPSESISPDVPSESTSPDGPSEPISPDAEAPESDDDDPLHFPLFKIPDSIDPKVKEICNSTDHPVLCMATAAHFLKGKANADAVLEVTIGAGMRFAKFAHSLAIKMIERHGASPELLSVLKDCKDSYDDAVFNFEKAHSACSERDVGTVNSMLSAVITDVGDCEDAFAGMETASPLSRYAEKLTNMTSNCLAIASLIET